MPRFSLFFAVLCLPLIVGCDGCRTDSSTDSGEDSELSAEDFNAGRPMPYPTDEKITTSGIKPGHWITAVQSLKSNNADSRGELNSISGMAAGSFKSGQKQKNWSESQAV